MNVHLVSLVLAASLGAEESPVKLTQFPSPMVEYTRRHPRLKEERPPGQRQALRTGTARATHNKSVARDTAAWAGFP